LLGFAAPTRPRCSKSITAADFFRDTPWFNIPTERLGNILIEPLYPRIGLLGGSGKPSKLAALAAARRKAAQEDKFGGPATASHLATQNAKAIDETVPGPATLSVERLDGPVVTIQNSPAILHNQHTSDPSNEFIRVKQPRRESDQKSDNDADDNIEALTPATERLQPYEEHTGHAKIQAPPSAFARTMLGSDADRVTEDNTHSFRYFSLPNSTDKNPFTGPSPDDVVLKAQTKGSVR